MIIKVVCVCFGGERGSNLPGWRGTSEHLFGKAQVQKSYILNRSPGYCTHILCVYPSWSWQSVLVLSMWWNDKTKTELNTYFPWLQCLLEGFLQLSNRFLPAKIIMFWFRLQDSMTKWVPRKSFQVACTLYFKFIYVPSVRNGMDNAFLSLLLFF